MYVESSASKLTQARIDAGLTQSEAGEIVGVIRSTITNYENGTRCPSIETLGKLIDTYKTDASWILGTGKH